MRALYCFVLLLVGLLGGCRAAAPRQAGIRANQVPNKRVLTESPTLERPVPRQ